MIQIKIYDTTAFNTIRVIDVANEAEALSAGTRWIAWYAEQGITHVAWDYLRPAPFAHISAQLDGKLGAWVEREAMNALSGMLEQ